LSEAKSKDNTIAQQGPPCVELPGKKETKSKKKNKLALSIALKKTKQTENNTQFKLDDFLSNL
jgi:hypothetical protein